MSATLIQIYDYETAIEAAFKLLFEQNDVASAYTSNDNPDTEGKRERPRIEITFIAGAEVGHASTHSTNHRADALTGSLILTVISNTKPEDVGSAQHSELRAICRNLMAKCRNAFKDDFTNGNAIGYLPFHQVVDVVQSGTAPSYENESGYYESVLSYDIKFFVRPNAWPAE